MLWLQQAPDDKRPDLVITCTRPCGSATPKRQFVDVSIVDPLKSTAPVDSLYTPLATAHQAAAKKLHKHDSMTKFHDGVVCPLIIEVFGGICKPGLDFLTNLTSDSSFDSPAVALCRATSLISVALQNYTCHTVTHAIGHLCTLPSCSSG